jgi:glycosyltransferase involved in cell wall biosynthesis
MDNLGRVSAPLTSIVVPTFNRAYCLPRTIESALAQANVRVEVIVVDDGSTDQTPSLIASRYGSEPRVRFIRQDNGGVAVARNTGMRAAQGDYIALLDSDDTWMPWKLELQLACMRARPQVGMTWTDMEAIDPEGNVLSGAYLRRMYSAYRWFPTSESLFRESAPLADIAPRLAPVVGERRFSVGDLSSAMIMGNLVHTSTVVFTRERYQKTGDFSDQYRMPARTTSSTCAPAAGDRSASSTSRPSSTSAVSRIASRVTRTTCTSRARSCVPSRPSSRKSGGPSTYRRA